MTWVGMRGSWDGSTRTHDPGELLVSLTSFVCNVKVLLML
jgi:hypothetical protein